MMEERDGLPLPDASVRVPAAITHLATPSRGPTRTRGQRALIGSRERSMHILNAANPQVAPWSWSDTLLNDLERAEVDIATQARQQNGSNVELQNEFSGKDPLRQLRWAHQLEFDSRLGWFALSDRVKLDVERMHPVRQPRVQGA